MSAENIALGVEFTPIEEGLAPITGHQYGGVFSRRIVASAKLRDTAGAPRPPFNGSTSVGYHGLAIPPHIEVEDDEIYLPIEPAMIIHSGSNGHDRAAKDLQTALM